MTSRYWRPDPFLTAIVGAVTVAALFPNLGVKGGPLHIPQATSAAVALVFFLHGAILPLDALWHGIRNIRLHLVCQATTFLVFPALGLLVLRGGFGLPPAIALGFFFMTTVSSTISSSVAMTAVAGGDVAGALFNATLSGVLGVFLTPILASTMAHTVGVHLSLPTVIEAIALKILLPLTFGQLCRTRLIGFLTRHRRSIDIADRASAVLIVYGAFCESVSSGVWSHDAFMPTLISVLVAIALLAIVSVSLALTTSLLDLERSSAITAYFCGSQKSLANGLPVAQALFGSAPALGLIVMPLLVYHQIQLAVGSIAAKRMRGRTNDE